MARDRNKTAKFGTKPDESGLFNIPLPKNMLQQLNIN